MNRAVNSFKLSEVASHTPSIASPNNLMLSKLINRQLCSEHAYLNERNFLPILYKVCRTAHTIISQPKSVCYVLAINLHVPTCKPNSDTACRKPLSSAQPHPYPSLGPSFAVHAACIAPSNGKETSAQSHMQTGFNRPSLYFDTY